MQDATTESQMISEQEAQVLRFTEIGLKWITGQITFDDVKQTLGTPKRFEATGDNIIDYAYFRQGMTIDFVYNKRTSAHGNPGIDSFGLRVSDGIRTNIPYQHFESLGLHRLVRGESIDGVRIEEGDFFVPVGVADASRFYPENLFAFNYRSPMPPDSPFDVYASLGYLGEWNDDRAAMAELSRVKKAVDLRKIGISRHYLTPEELEQRRLAKHQKYGMSNLRTGMVCPETGHGHEKPDC